MEVIAKMSPIGSTLEELRSYRDDFAQLIKMKSHSKKREEKKMYLLVTLEDDVECDFTVHFLVQKVAV